jgi:pentatricopeptide repeat protein
LQVFEQMQADGMQATEVTYGCLLVACERLGDIDRAFALYKQACDQGITPSDACHNILINVCTTTGRFVSTSVQPSVVETKHPAFFVSYPPKFRSAQGLCNNPSCMCKVL